MTSRILQSKTVFKVSYLLERILHVFFFFWNEDIAVWIFKTLPNFFLPIHSCSFFFIITDFSGMASRICILPDFWHAPSSVQWLEKHFKTLPSLSKFSQQHIDDIFFQKIGTDISCKLSLEETICMKCQSLFSGRKKKEKYFKTSPVEIFTKHA